MRAIQHRFRNAFYYLVAATFLILCAVTGGLLVAGAEYIEEIAYSSGRSSILLDLSLVGLSEIEVYGGQKHDI